jgi:hypothetical protein
MKHAIVDLIFALGPLFLVGAVGVPFVLAGLAIKYYIDEQEVNGPVLLLGGSALVLGVVLVPPYVTTWRTCSELTSQIQTESSVDAMVDESLINLGLVPTPDIVTQAERDFAAKKCEDLPLL